MILENRLRSAEKRIGEKKPPRGDAACRPDGPFSNFPTRTPRRHPFFTVRSRAVEGARTTARTRFSRSRPVQCDPSVVIATGSARGRWKTQNAEFVCYQRPNDLIARNRVYNDRRRESSDISQRPVTSSSSSVRVVAFSSCVHAARPIGNRSSR